MLRLLTVLLLGACSSAPPARHDPVAPAPTPAVRATAVCPYSMPPSEVWRYELFPGCPRPPFRWTGTLCDGACPTPCSVRGVDRTGPRPYMAYFTYDARGQLELTHLGDRRSERAGSELALRPQVGDRICTRDGRRGTCNRQPVGYDDRGNVISYEADGDVAKFAYDAAGRLETETIEREVGTIAIAYGYDAAGRIAQVVQSGWGTNYTTTHTYDDTTGLLARWVRVRMGGDDQPDPPERRTTTTATFEYDAQRRPVHILVLDEAPGLTPARDEQTFAYDCPAPRPFDEALAAAEQFKTRACACTDAACGAQVASELADWRDGLAGPRHADPSEPEGVAFGAAIDAIRACVTRAAAPPTGPDSLDSSAILARKATARRVKVKYVLLGWSAVHTNDPRGAARDRATLESLVRETLGKLQAGAKIEPLMAELSEDPTTAASGGAHEVTPESPYVPPFKDLSLRLKVREAGVVKTTFGIFIIRRIE